MADQPHDKEPKQPAPEPLIPAHPRKLSTGTVLLMAITVGVTVANNYYAQPLLADIARSFGLSVTRAGAVAMLSQIGTAFGMFLFVPLGDKFERRSLISVLLLAAAVSLVFVATAQNEPWLAAACFAVGATAATVHVVVPFAAHLASPEQRGRVVGTVLSGLLFGILLARTFSGWLGAYFGWRSVFGLAAVFMVVLAAVVRMLLPADQPELTISWPELMRSTMGLVKKHATLRESALLGALAFCSFSAFWTTLVFFLQSPAYGYGSIAAGLFGLVGAVGAAGAPTFGHLAGKHGARTTVYVAIWITLLSFGIMGAAGSSLLGLVAGVVAMDLGVQLSHVSNQTRIYEIDPSARSRLNMVYMVCYFTGGAVGSYLGAVSWRWAGWWGVCGFGIAVQIIALLVHAYFIRRAPRTL
ncbi:MFS transporter [Verrucomicrobiota bacterium sgz303538]